MAVETRIVPDTTVETRLVWNPGTGFRLELPTTFSPEREMTTEELFLGMLLVKSKDRAFIETIASEFEAMQIKH